MKFNFKRIMSVFGAFALVGASMGGAFAVANTYPTPFVTNGVADTAIIYGVGSASTDLAAATKIDNHLLSLLDSSEINEMQESIITGDFSNSLGVTEDEIVLGGEIKNGKLGVDLTDSKIPNLVDSKIEWDDGDNSKTNFDVHEEIRLNGMSLITTLDENEIKETALTNDEDLEYRYIFEETFNTDRIGHDDADTLTISILGKEYEVSSLDTDSIEITVSTQKVFVAGQSEIIDGKIITVDEIFEEYVQIGDVFIDEGKTKTINGLEVYVDTIAYHSASGLQSKAVLRIGEDLLKTYQDGDDYIGENETNVKWVWSIENPGEANGWIGVKYDQRQLDQDDELVYAGGSYDFPENYASIQFEGLTEVTYGDFKLYFEDNNDFVGGGDAVILEGHEDDSFLIDSIESSTIAIHYNGTHSLYYLDEDNDFVYSGLFNETIDADLIQDDINLIVSMEGTNLLIGDLNFTLEDTISFGTAEDAESDDIIVEGTNIGTYEYDVMTHSGIIIEKPEYNLESDIVEFSVPSDTIYGIVNVVGQGQEIVTESVIDNETVIDVPVELGSLIVTDAEIASVQDKNLIIVGGSCINAVAAKLLGSDIPVCGADFTALTTVGSGQYLMDQYTSPYNAGKVALLIAGYDAVDTTVGVDSLLA